MILDSDCRSLLHKLRFSIIQRQQLTTFTWHLVSNYVLIVLKENWSTNRWIINQFGHVSIFYLSVPTSNIWLLWNSIFSTLSWQINFFSSPNIFYCIFVLYTRSISLTNSTFMHVTLNYYGFWILLTAGIEFELNKHCFHFCITLWLGIWTNS